jgi:zinc transport system ATP-binding protein
MLICAKNVTLSYEKNIVMHDLTFEVNSGDYLCIVGENGSGKSTLIKAMLGLKGTIGGHFHFGDGLTKNDIGYLPQQTTLQRDFPASVKEIVLSGTLNNRGLRPFYNRDEKIKAKENMQRLDIYNIRNKSFKELSGGQQQRVLLARALCSAKKMLFLDEPVSGLDPKVTADFYKLIKDLNNEGITIVMVSHDIDSAVKYATHILHLKNKPLFFGRTEDYLMSEPYRKFMGECSND